MRVVLMHGKDTDPTKKWYPWLAAEMKKFGVDFLAPVLPDLSDPSCDAWISELEKTKPDSDTVLIGHSRGGVAIMRWLERQPRLARVAKVILVAVNSGRLQDKAIPNESNYGFYTEQGYNFEKIKSHSSDFVVLHSRDNQWVPFTSGEDNAKRLGAKFIALDGCGHFGKGVNEIPELLEEIIRFDNRKALLVPMNTKHEVLIQDRRGHKAPAWGYFGGEIEQGETPLEAVIRESKEELALDI